MRFRWFMVSLIIISLACSVQASTISGSSQIRMFGESGGLVNILFTSSDSSSQLTHAEIKLLPNGFASLTPFSAGCGMIAKTYTTQTDPDHDLTKTSSLILNGPSVNSFTLDFSGFDSGDKAVYCTYIGPDPSGTNTISVTIDGCVFTGTYTSPSWQASFSGQCGPLPFPEQNNPPGDPDHDGLFEDVNGNGLMDYDDAVVLFWNINWAQANEPLNAFNFNHNGVMDYDDAVTLFWEI